MSVVVFRIFFWAGSSEISAEFGISILILLPPTQDADTTCKYIQSYSAPIATTSKFSDFCYLLVVRVAFRKALQQRLAPKVAVQKAAEGLAGRVETMWLALEFWKDFLRDVQQQYGRDHGRYSVY